MLLRLNDRENAMLNPTSTGIRFSTIPALIGIFAAALILSACKKPVAPDSVEPRKASNVLSYPPTA
jgi:hypothetical protein